jgi:hypothetical protein
LLENGADIEASDNGDKTPLHWACVSDHLTVDIELLGHGAGIEANNDSKDETSILGKRKSRGANTEAKDYVGETPLHKACYFGLPVVKALRSGGANILARNNYGQLPIHKAVSGGDTALAKYLLQQMYATTRRLPLHALLEDLTWIGNPISDAAPPIRFALHEHVLGTDHVVELIEYLVEQNPELLRSREQDGSLSLNVASSFGASFAIVQSLVTLYKASVKR